VPELPLSFIEWPGLNTHFDAYMTVGHGVYPGVCIITCPAQDNPIAAFGTLVFHAGESAMKFPACRVDKLEMGIDPNRGRIWQITILDRRWRWQFETIKGWYNVRLGNLSIKPGTEKTPQELAALCLDAMGETVYDVSAMPNSLRPEVRWDPPAAPMNALSDLCDMTACRIIPWFHKGVFDGVRVIPFGDGEALPPTDLEFNEGCDTAELPDKAGVYAGPTIIDVHLPLNAVISSDLFSNCTISPQSLFGANLNAASVFQRFPAPDENALPVYDPERVPPPWWLWRECSALLRKLMQNQIGAWFWFPVPQQLPPNMLPAVVGTWASWTAQMQAKLREEALRYYQVRLPFTVPGWGEVTSHDQYVLETERAVTFEDIQTGVIRRAPAYVYGSYNIDSYGVNSEALWDLLHTPVDPNKPLVYQGGFSIDPENRLVRFGEHMYRNTCPENKYAKVKKTIYNITGTEQWVPKPWLDSGVTDAAGQPIFTMYWEPAALVLVTAIRLLDNNRSQHRYSKVIDVIPTGKKKKISKKGLPPDETRTDWSAHEDIQLRGRVKYTMATSNYPKNWIKPVKTEYLNEKECEDNASFYLSARMQKYQTRVPQRARYPGLVPIQLDGAIEQVTYSSSNTEGAYTVACRDSEWAYGTLMPYEQRRQLKELWTYRRAVAERDHEKIANMRRWVFVPSASGVHFGLTPPG
jgi:hypothetical protein